MPRSSSEPKPPFQPDALSAKRIWYDLGGDLEGSYDGRRYVDIRSKISKKRALFISQGALERALKLFQPAPLAK